MTTVRVFAPAKINLALHVTGRRSDGYHELDSLVVFARDVGDQVTANTAQNITLSVTGPMSAGVPEDESNLVFRAAKLMQGLRGIDDGAHLAVEKHLPNGGGVGGGSSDAAATISALAKIWKTAPLTSEEAVTLGADVPVCLAAPRPIRMSGIGDLLEPVPRLPPIWLALVNPGVRIPTGRVFGLFDDLYGFGSLELRPMPPSWDFEDFHIWLLRHYNDLTKCAREDAPAIGTVLDVLHALPGCVDADMSGSGGTCWGLFEHEADALAASDNLSLDHPDWWVRVTAVAS